MRARREIAKPQAWFACGFAISVALFLLNALTLRAADIPVELQPYRVQLTLADDRADRVAREDLIGELVAASRRTWGGRWNLQLETQHPSPWPEDRSFRRFHPELPAEHDPDEFQVRYFVNVTLQAPGVRIAVRAWEPLWNHFSPVAAETVYDLREAPLRMMQLCRDLFRPRAVWEKTDDYSARIVVQAAAIAAPDAEFPILRENEVFTPWLIARKRDGTIQRQQTVPWTYFVAQHVAEGRGDVRVISGLRAPLGAKPRGRIEYIAVAARSQWPATQLDCLSLSQPPRALAAHRVEVTAIDLTKPAGEEPEPPPPDLLVTDRLGGVRLPAGDLPGMVWTAFYSGTLKLARVPIVPGSVDRVRIDLPDDAIRLQAEGQLQIIQSELVDVVAMRSVQMAAARAAAKKTDWSAAKEKMAAARRINSPQTFLEKVSAVRAPALSAALQKKDRTTEQRVARMCDETVELIRHYLDDDRLKLLQEEVDELEIVDQQSKADAREIAAPARAASPARVQPAAPPTSPKPPAGGF